MKHITHTHTHTVNCSKKVSRTLYSHHWWRQEAQDSGCHGGRRCPSLKQKMKHITCWGCTIGGVYLPCIWMYHWWSLSTLYLDVPLVEFIYLVFGCTIGGVYLPCIWMYHWWSLSTLYLDVPLVEFIYLVFGCTIGGVYLPCIWMYHWWSLSTLYFLACQVTVTVGNSGSKLSCSGDIFFSANQLALLAHHLFLSLTWRLSVLRWNLASRFSKPLFATSVAWGPWLWTGSNLQDHKPLMRLA